ncbi:4-alpha-glucanotransferase [Leptospira sp. 96542]|nr:4-alpha-glucanotransferase [Leptospira sp. 96542]
MASDHLLNLKRRRAGVLVSLSSLLSEHSFECGDIYSLIPLASWAKEVGLSIIQLLPLNDTGFGISPYSSISAFAIDPLYISLHDLGINVRSRRKKTTSLKINQGRIRDLKFGYLREFFRSNLDQNKKDALLFLEKQNWCKSYVTFRILYEEFEGKNWWAWDTKFHSVSYAYNYVESEKNEEMLFWAFLQKIAYDQLTYIKHFYEKLGLYLKGDMPILTSRNSCDVWEHPEYFHLHLQAGAPPDQFSKEGQAWGFPVLNWDAIKDKSYLWWKDRLTFLENFFHLYRIDHVIGMYRIWAIPAGDENALGGWFHPQIGASRMDFENVGLLPDEFQKLGLVYPIEKDRYIFYWDFWKKDSYQSLPESTKALLFPLSEVHLREDEILWRQSGETILDVFETFTSMLPCAEDLGSIPGFIRDSMFERDMIGIDVVRWTKSFTTGEFIEPKDYRKQAVSTLSTHDTSLAMDWWVNEGDTHEKQSFFFRETSDPKSKSDVLERLLTFSFSTNSLFSIQILQDLVFGEEEILENAVEHRINTPGTAESKNWSYRFPLSIEDFAKNKERNEKIRKIVSDSTRNP